MIFPAGTRGQWHKTMKICCVFASLLNNVKAFLKYAYYLGPAGKIVRGMTSWRGVFASEPPTKSLLTFRKTRSKNRRVKIKK
jgi:hypothetical protein